MVTDLEGGTRKTRSVLADHRRARLGSGRRGDLVHGREGWTGHAARDQPRGEDPRGVPRAIRGSGWTIWPGRGSCCSPTIERRTDLVFVDTESRAPTLLPWAHYSSAVALSMNRKLLVGSSTTEPTEEGAQSELALLRKTDGSPPQVLGEGTALDLTTDGQWALVRTRDSRLVAIPTGPGQPRTNRSARPPRRTLVGKVGGLRAAHRPCRREAPGFRASILSPEG